MINVQNRQWILVRRTLDFRVSSATTTITTKLAVYIKIVCIPTGNSVYHQIVIQSSIVCRSRQTERIDIRVKTTQKE